MRSSVTKDGAVVVLSGGQDSTTLLGWAKNRFDDLLALTFDYKQRHSIEIEQAKIISQKLGIEHEVIKIDIFDKLGESALLKSRKQNDINGAHHQKSDLPASFVPNRNALFFTIAHAYAQKFRYRYLITGINQTDYSGYPDCKEEFVKPLQKALNIGSNSNIEFIYPLISLSKAQTFELAKKEGVLDLVLELSHTCYNGNREFRHEWGYGCAECPACKLRAAGWREFVAKQGC